MMRARRWTVVLSLCALVVLLTQTGHLHAQGSRRGFSGFRKYSEVTLRDLPGGVHRQNAPRVLRLHATDEQSLSKHKQPGGLVVAPGATAVAVPSTVQMSDSGFEGINFATAGAIPPDTQIAVGPNHVLEAVNLEVRVWSRPTTTPHVLYDTDLASFFGVSIFDFFTIVSDPRVVYDPISDRWFVSCVTLDPYLYLVGDWRIAVSKTNDPTGAYTLYQAEFNGEFPDFPSLGLSDDKLAVTGNAFDLPTMSNFLGSEFLVANKADLVAGVSNPASTYYGHPQPVDTIQVAKSLSSTSKLYLAAVPADGGSKTLEIWSIDGVPGVGNGDVATTTPLTLQAPLAVPPDAVEPGSVRIMTNDARLQDLSYRNGQLWMSSNTGCTPDGGATVRSCLHFAQVDTATMTIAQEITYGESGVDYYYPAVTTDAAGNMVSVFTRSSSSEYPSVYTGGHQSSDAPGTFQSPTIVRAGVSAYDASPNDQRWGDYSGIAVDPFDGGASVWLAGQLMGAGGGMNWTTWIAQVSAGAGGCQLPSTPAGLAATAGDTQVALAWNASSGASTYSVKRATTSGGPYTIMAANLTNRTYTDTGLTNGTPYYYVVSASNTCGESANSSQVSATPTAVQPPLAPTNLKATGAKKKIMLTWTQSTSTGITQNRIYRSQNSGGPFAAIATIGANTSYTDTQAVSGTTYYYAVTALRDTQESVQSTVASAKAK
jgi:fibronectin type III domain protein